MNIPSHVMTEAFGALCNLINDMGEQLKELGGCDHSVGICYCDLRSRLAAAEGARDRLAPYTR